MRPSFVTLTLYPCLFPSSFSVSSTILGFPLILLTTSCSNPEDFVNTRIDSLVAASKRFESARPAPVSAVARRNSLRLGNALISLGCARPDARSRGNFRIYILRSSPALASPLPTNNTPRSSTLSGFRSGRTGPVDSSPPLHSKNHLPRKSHFLRARRLPAACKPRSAACSVDNHQASRISFRIASALPHQTLQETPHIFVGARSCPRSAANQ